MLISFLSRDAGEREQRDLPNFHHIAGKVFAKDENWKYRHVKIGCELSMDAQKQMPSINQIELAIKSYIFRNLSKALQMRYENSIRVEIV